MMVATMEVVQQNILDYFRTSFMVAGHTKFAPDQLFALTARDFYASDIFNERELLEVMQRHATVMFDSMSHSALLARDCYQEIQQSTWNTRFT